MWYNHITIVMSLQRTIAMENFGQLVVEGIRDNIRNKRVTPFGSVESTGNAANSLFYKVVGGKLIIGSSWAYITVLEDGRRPGKYPPLEVVEQWIDDKPVLGDIGKKSLAFLIARSISEKGSILYQQGGHSGILSDYINRETITNKLTRPLAKAIAQDIGAVLFKGKV